MSTHIDPRRSIAAWLEAEAPERAPARLVDASRERIRTTRQRRAWWPAWRTSDMNSFAKLAIAAAAVVVVAIVGYNLLPGRAAVGGAPATPSPSTSPSTSPSPTLALGTPGPSGAVPEGSLAAGTYSMNVDGTNVDVGFTVPVGWSWVGQYDLLSTGDPADEIAIALWSGQDLQVYTDPCNWEKAKPDPPTGPTARELAEALAAQSMRNGSTPLERKAAGPDGSDQWTGWLVELTVPDDIDFNTCTRGEFRSWGPDNLARYHQGPGQRDTVWAVDVGPDTRIVIFATYLPGTPEETVTELDAILDSIVISRSG